MFTFVVCLTITPVNVFALKKGGIESNDIDELEHDENEYANVIFKGKINGKTKEQLFYLTVVNQKTGELFSFNFSTKRKMVTKGKLPMGEYAIEEGGVYNDWTGTYVPEKIKFSINDRSAAKIINVTFGASKEESETKEDREKIYQVKQKSKKEIKQQAKNNSEEIKKVNRSSDQRFYIFFTLGFILGLGLVVFIVRFIKRFR